MADKDIGCNVLVVSTDPKDKESFMVEARQEDHFPEVKTDELVKNLEVKTPQMDLKFHRDDKVKDASTFEINASGVDLKLKAEFDGLHESLYWATPLHDNKLTHFETWKRVGIPLKPFEYTFQGRVFSCG